MKAVVAAFFAFNQDPVGAFSVIAKIQRFVCSSSSSQQQGLVILSRHTEEGSSVGRGGDAAAGGGAARRKQGPLLNTEELRPPAGRMTPATRRDTCPVSASRDDTCLVCCK